MYSKGGLRDLDKFIKWNKGWFPLQKCFYSKLHFSAVTFVLCAMKGFCFSFVGEMQCLKIIQPGDLSLTKHLKVLFRDRTVAIGDIDQISNRPIFKAKNQADIITVISSSVGQSSSSNGDDRSVYDSACPIHKMAQLPHNSAAIFSVLNPAITRNKTCIAADVNHHRLTPARKKVTYLFGKRSKPAIESNHKKRMFSLCDHSLVGSFYRIQLLQVRCQWLFYKYCFSLLKCGAYVKSMTIMAGKNKGHIYIRVS